jgi:hypothetical protein
MPAPQLEVPPELLQREILRLRTAVNEGRRRACRQRKAELAALLFEAHRTGAYTSWGYENLGSYAREALEMKPATLAKYKAAGKALHETVLYERFMNAVCGGEPHPALPDVSELAAMQSIDKQVGKHHTAAALLGEGASLRTVKTLAKMSAYGDARPEGRRILSELDSFIQGVRRGQRALRGLLIGTGDLPREELRRRFRTIRDECEGMIRVLALLEEAD